jgi:DNA-binding NtrC family response regulator
MLEIKPDLKTIITSGYSSAAFVEDIPKSGTFVFVEKPYQLEELLRIIRQVLDDYPSVHSFINVDTLLYYE